MSIGAPRPKRTWLRALLLVLIAASAVFVTPALASAQESPLLQDQVPPGDDVDTPDDITVPQTDAIPDLTVSVGDAEEGSSQPLTVVLVLTVLALAPTLLIMLTSFTRIIIVLGITRNAMSLPGIPPNQVLVGLALFLSIFVMSPVLSEANEVALQPLLNDEISQTEAFELGLEPFREFMLAQVRPSDLEMFIDLAEEDVAGPDDVSLTTLIPAFVMSELRAAFIIGFLVFVPFLIIDIVISATLMSMGMVMLPPVVISLPFKLLLFVIVDGWALLVPTIVTSFGT